MKSSRINGKVLVSVLTSVVLLGPVSRALADGWDGDRDHHDRSHENERSHESDRGHEFERGHEFDRGHEHDRRWFHSEHYFPFGHELRELPRGFLSFSFGGGDYFFCEGVFYRGRGGAYVVVEAPIGSMVTTIPTCSPVIIDGLAYYMVNDNVYVETKVGYQVVAPPRELVVQTPSVAIQVPATSVVVPAPVAIPVPATPSPVVAPALPAAENNFTVNIPNARGTYTSVVLTRSGSGFVGPQGEFYTEFPRVEQLKVMYGK